MKNPLIEPLEARIAPAAFSIVSPAAIQEGNSGTRDLVFTVTVTGEHPSNVSVAFATADGTATRLDSDYTATSGALYFFAR